MATNLLASQVPIPPPPASIPTINSATSSGVGFGIGPNLDQITSAGLKQALNKILSGLVLNGMYGGNGFGLISGYAPTAGSGLTLNVASGSAFIGAPVQMGAQTITLTDNANNYVWLKADGTLTKQTTTTIPSGNVTYLGRVVTVSGSISDIDTSGVVYLIGGLRTRTTADVGKPTDSPSSQTIFLTKTLAGDYLWDGSTYRRLAGDIAAPKDRLISGDVGFIPADHQLQIFDLFTVEAGASFTNYGRFRVV
jgi:hypothetical protein